MTGSGDADDPPVRNGIAFKVDADDRDRRGRFHQRLDCVWPGGEDDIAVESDQLLGELGDAVEHVPREPLFNNDVLTLDVTCLLEPVEQRDDEFALDIQEKTNPRNFPPRLLRARRKRPSRRRAAEQGDKLASFHSTSSSARSRNDSGIVRPSALAVVRLMTRSNFVGCSTGMSAGLAPCKILSTISAARRNRSG